MCIYQRIYCLKVTQGGNIMGGQNTFDTLTKVFYMAKGFSCTSDLLCGFKKKSYTQKITELPDTIGSLFELCK